MTTLIPIAERRLGLDVDALSPQEPIADLPCALLVTNGDADPYILIPDAERLFNRAGKQSEL